MRDPESIVEYKEVLQVRWKARRRDSLLLGAVFLVSLVVTLALGLLDLLHRREIYLIVGVLVAFGLGFLQAWVRLEVIRNNLEILEAIQRERFGQILEKPQH